MILKYTTLKKSYFVFMKTEATATAVVLSLINIVESVFAAIMMFDIVKFSPFMFSSVRFFGKMFLLLDMSSFVYLQWYMQKYSER
jgi:hypothetical protein